jgi:hypothetical protein
MEPRKQLKPAAKWSQTFSDRANKAARQITFFQYSFLQIREQVICNPPAISTSLAFSGIIFPLG